MSLLCCSCESNSRCAGLFVDGVALLVLICLFSGCLLAAVWRQQLLQCDWVFLESYLEVHVLMLQRLFWISMHAFAMLDYLNVIRS